MLSATKLVFAVLIGLVLQATVFANQVKMTFYWVSRESDFSGSKSIALKTCSGKSIAMVSHEFATAARMEGTARLNNGKVINLDCNCGGGYSCFSIIEQGHFPYGKGAKDNALTPFVSVAANDIPLGSTLMVNQLKGVKMPNGRTHNGCVRVDDQGWSFGGNQIDLLVGDKKYYHQMDSRNFNKVDISRTKCNPVA
ncbi:hypothetical protein K7432_012688 [Basidiobolus ranarum]|uniref:3D domain-containing protein n=1 Tax=Basidiobolus ranarum TaxID=34480 RepID=A0ABR2VRY5_9FUNG